MFVRGGHIIFVSLSSVLRVIWGPFHCPPWGYPDKSKVSLWELSSPPQCPEPGKVPGKVPGELQGNTAFHYACQVCGPSTSLPRRGNLRKYVTAHSSALPFPSQACTYHGPWPPGVGESCAVPFVGWCALMPSVSFATTQFSALYLSGGARPRDYPTSLCYLQANQA